MIQIQRVLFPTDFSSCALQVLPHALFIAERWNAELHMLHALLLHEHDSGDPEQRFPELAEIYDQREKLASSDMAKLLQDCSHQLPHVQQVQRRGLSAGPVILDYADEQEIDLIVMGTHGRRGFRHLLLGSVAEEVVRLAPCPVLTFRERKEPLPLEKIARILVPVDFSEHSELALSHAKELASCLEADLELLHVIDQPAYPRFYDATTSPNIVFELPELERKSREAMEKMLEGTPGPDVSSTYHVAHGRAAEQIVSFAELSACDLVVIATHGLTGIQHLLMGSVAEQVIRRVPCPTVTVKSFGKSLIQ